MKLTVLGCNGPYPKAGGACTGFLLEDGGTRIVLDMGNGSLGKLQQYIKPEDITAVILSHLHPDHMSDIMVLRYAADIRMRSGLMKKPIEIYAPPEPAAEHERLRYKEAVRVTASNPAERLDIGGFSISFRELTHPYQNFAVAIEKDGRKFVYSGDTSPNEGLVDFASNADLFLCESGILERNEASASAAHLSAAEAADIAARAGVKRLVLTHFSPETRVEDYIQRAAQLYKGTVEGAEEGKSWIIGE